MAQRAARARGRRAAGARRAAPDLATRARAPGEREWCDPEVLRRLRRASLAVLRREIEPAERRALAVFLPSWQGVDRHPAAGAGVERLREILVPLQGLALPAELWERAVLPRRVGAYSTSWLDQLCAAGEVVWVGAGRARAAAPAASRSTSATTPRRSGRRPPRPGSRLRASAEHELIRERLRASPCFFGDLVAEIDAPIEALQEALWDLVWAGEVTNDAWAPLRAPRLALTRGGAAAGARFANRARAGASRRRVRASRAQTRAPVQGRWSLVAPLFDAGRRPGRAAAHARRAAARALRHPDARARARRGRRRAASRRSTTRSPSSRRSASAAAATSSRASAAPSSRCPGPSSGCARSATSTRRRPLVLAGERPGAAVRRRAAVAGRRRGAAQVGRGAPARVAGAHVVLVGAELACYVEAGGRGLQTFVSGEPLRIALSALADAVRAGRIRKLELERVDGEPVLGGPAEALLVELGFRSGPRRLTLSA